MGSDGAPPESHQQFLCRHFPLQLKQGPHVLLYILYDPGSREYVPLFYLTVIMMANYRSVQTEYKVRYRRYGRNGPVVFYRA